MSLQKSMCTLVLWLSPILSANACPLDQIRVGLFDFPPLYYLTHAGHTDGTLVKLLDNAAQTAGCDWREHFYADAPSLGKGLITGDIDLIMAIRHPLLERKALYGQVPLTQLQLYLYHYPNSVAATSPRTLRGKRMAVIRGYGYGGIIEQLIDPAAGIDIRVAESHRAAFDLLKAGSVEYVLDYHGPANAVLGPAEAAALTWAHWSTQDLFFVASRHLAYPEALLETLERALPAPNQNPE